MTAANALAALALSFWGLMSLAGASAYQSIVSQHVPGYPNSGQINLYLTAPIVVACLLLAAVIVVNRKGRGAIFPRRSVRYISFRCADVLGCMEWRSLTDLTVEHLLTSRPRHSRVAKPLGRNRPFAGVQ